MPTEERGCGGSDGHLSLKLFAVILLCLKSTLVGVLHTMGIGKCYRYFFVLGKAVGKHLLAYPRVIDVSCRFSLVFLIPGWRLLPTHPILFDLRWKYQGKGRG